MTTGSKEHERKIAERVAARYERAMARQRDKFKEALAGRLVGAIGEFYKATVAKKNGRTNWVEHWMAEAKRLAQELSVDVRHPIRGFTDRRKAFDEITNEIKADNVGHRRWAEGEVKRDFELTKLNVHLDDADERAFWELVNDAVEPALRAFEPPKRKAGHITVAGLAPGLEKIAPACTLR